MIRILLFLILAVIVGVVAVGAHAWFTDRGRQTTAPEFTELAGTFVDGELRYPADPAAAFRFDPAFEYIGGQKFILYGTANVEQHFFVETHADGSLKCIFWLQFEEIRPGIDWQFDYSGSPLRTQIGEFDFYTDTAAGVRHPIFEYGAPGTDGYLARTFAASQGYRIPKDYAYARQVHLPTEDRRKELLIIVMEDLAPTGFRGRDLQPGGAHEDEWPAISEAHLARIEQVMTITPLE